MNLPSIDKNSIVHVTMICIVLVRHNATFGSFHANYFLYESNVITVKGICAIVLV